MILKVENQGMYNNYLVLKRRGRMGAMIVLPLIQLLLLSVANDAFVPMTNARSQFSSNSSQFVPEPKARKNLSGSSNQKSLHTTLLQQLDSFDFSSRRGWDEFYLQGDPDISRQNRIPNREMNFEYEWHSSIPNKVIISEISPGSSVLMVGTGNSALPRLLYIAHDGNSKITCIDYSEPCVSMLKTMYSKLCPNMDFVCGDATKLLHVLDETYGVRESGYHSYHVVVDKGLMDALMCGEGWNKDVEKYIHGASSVMKEGEGRLLLISYKLSSSTKEFLNEVGNRNGIVWEFDIKEKSSDRVSFSVGLKE